MAGISSEKSGVGKDGGETPARQALRMETRGLILIVLVIFVVYLVRYLHLLHRSAP